MDFIGTGRRLAQGDVGDAARAIGIETAVLLAFLEVEAAGRGFDSQNRPKMLFEPHVFWRNLEGAYRDVAATLGLAYPKWKRDYPADSYPRLEKAIDRVAREPAFRSASYGLPQILGENHQAAGFASAEQMFGVMKQGEREQLLAMVTLLKSWGLAKHLTGKDFSKPESWWPAVERYNGKSFRANGYDVKCATAYVKHTKGEPMTLPADTPMSKAEASGAILKHGMKGEAVRVLQADLQALGYPFLKGIDGRFGDETLANVRLFQAAADLTIDGKVGDATRKAIAAALAAKDGDMSPSGPDWPRDKLHPLLAALLAILKAIFNRK